MHLVYILDFVRFFEKIPYFLESKSLRCTSLINPKKYNEEEENINKLHLLYVTADPSR